MPLDSWDITVAHLALFSRPAYATPDSFVPFCITKSNCFVLAVCERERMQDKEWLLKGGLGTEIINARLPATPHYSVRALFLSTPLHREFSVWPKTKGTFLCKKLYLYYKYIRIIIRIDFFINSQVLQISVTSFY